MDCRKNLGILSAFTIIFGLLIIFYSPLFWFIGEQLVARDLPKKSDAIVVFSGDGKVSYQNLIGKIVSTVTLE